MFKNRAFALILMLTIAIPLVIILPANAQVPVLTKKTYAYIGATPNPVGVGQETLIHVGITDELQTAAHGWEGLTVTVTKPDGTTETLGPFRTDSTGGTGTVYVPTMVGTYYLQSHFPAQWYNWTLYGGADVRYEASSSEKLALVVQEDPVPYHPGFPLPSEYWSRPISAEFREWNMIAGNFLDSTRYMSPLVPYSEMPKTAHILWAKTLELGGLAGGIEFGPQSYDHGDAYEGRFDGSVVIQGVLFYNKYPSIGGTRVEQIVVAVDLHTGEVLWEKPLIDPDGVSRRLSFGQVFYWDSYNQHSAYAYLWATSGSTWHAFDPFTGRWMYTMTNVPSGTNLYGPKGEIYRYTVNLNNGWVTLWNSSRVVSSQGSWIRNNLGTTFDAARGIEWNKTIPEVPGAVQAVFFEDRIIGMDTVGRAVQNMITGRINQPVPFWGISLKPGQEGLLLFNTTWTPPQGDLFLSFGDASVEAGVFTLWSKESRRNYGFDINTGRHLWTTEPQHYLDAFGSRIKLRYGNLYTTGFSGEVYAYDVTTGSLMWHFNISDPLNEILWGANWPPLFAFFTGDGKILLFHMEHSPVDPMPRGAPTIVLDAETGEEVWRMDGLRGNRWGGHMVIGDGIIGFLNSYDERIYAIGKGPSETTVTAAPKVSVHGSSVLVEGTVTDISPGTDDYTLSARFPHGVPAVSDDDMSEWMEYVYLQYPRPSDVSGVEVVLTTIDPNGNVNDIGTVTSDASGTFGHTWQPEIPGQYTVIATFAGSKSYWSSYAQTYITVEESPEVTSVEEPTITLPPIEMYIAAATAAIITAIAIVGLLILRKRP